jgi:hypothetical protein
MCDPHTLYELESSGTKLRQLINLAGRWRASLKGFWPLIWNSLSSL